MLGKSDVSLEISSITIFSSVRIYIETTMGYPQFSMSEKLKKKDLEYHTSILV